MTRLASVRIRCDECRVLGDLHNIDGVIFDPPGWVRMGTRGLCPSCAREMVGVPSVTRETAARAIAALQALVATELGAQTQAQRACVPNGVDSMARRMKRVQVLSKFLDALCSLYQMSIQPSATFPFMTLGGAALALQELLQVEIAQGEAGPLSMRQRSELRRSRPEYDLAGIYSDDGPQPIAVNALFRFSEVARIAQKLAQLEATRAGDVAKSPEDEELENAFSDSVFGGRLRPAWNQAVPEPNAMLASLMAMLERTVTAAENKALRAAAEPSPVEELAELMHVAKQMREAGRDATVLDARITAVEERLAVTSALVSEAQARDVTPALPAGAEHKFRGAPGAPDGPPSADELEIMARDHGDDAVRNAFPEAFARLQEQRAQRNAPLEGEIT